MTLIKMGTSLVALSQLCSILSIPKRGVFCHAMSGRNFHKILFKLPGSKENKLYIMQHKLHNVNFYIANEGNR